MVKPNRADQKRRELRAKLWPGAEDELWGSSSEKGYFCAPRTLPLLMRLLSDKAVVGNLDCGSVYVELLARDRGQALVEIKGPDEHAFHAGYDGQRGARSWRERMRMLEEIGAIRIKPKAHDPKSIGFVLIRHPAVFIDELRQKGLVDDVWLDTYKAHCVEFGATAPVKKKQSLKVVQGGRKRIRIPTKTA